MYTLTEHGEKLVRNYLAELAAKRKEILDASKDTANDTDLPSREDVLLDVEFLGLDENNEYYNGWALTALHRHEVLAGSKKYLVSASELADNCNLS